MNMAKTFDCEIKGSVAKHFENFRYLGTTLSKHGSLNLEFK